MHWKPYWQPFFELNHWYVRKGGIFQNWGAYKMEYHDHAWYVLDLYLFRIGIWK